MALHRYCKGSLQVGLMLRVFKGINVPILRTYSVLTKVPINSISGLRSTKCESIQLIVDEVFDASFGTVAGAGLTLSGINMVIGAKKAYTTLKPSRSFG